MHAKNKTKTKSGEIQFSEAAARAEWKRAKMLLLLLFNSGMRNVWFERWSQNEEEGKKGRDL